MTTIEELQGIVAGLVSVVKELTTNVSQVNHTVGNMAQSVPAASNSHSLRMSSIQLPSFRRDSVVQDDISEFLERFIQQTSHLRFWNNSVLATGHDLSFRSPKLQKAIPTKRQRKNLTFVSNGYVQSSANRRKTNAAD